MKIEYPKMVYKNEKKEIVPYRDEVGYHYKVVHSKEEHEKLGSEWGEHPESVSEVKAEKKSEAKQKVILEKKSE